MSNKSQQDKRKFWVRLICIVLVVLLGGSTLVAAIAGLL